MKFLPTFQHSFKVSDIIVLAVGPARSQTDLQHLCCKAVSKNVTGWTYGQSDFDHNFCQTVSQILVTNSYVAIYVYIVGWSKENKGIALCLLYYSTQDI